MAYLTTAESKSPKASQYSNSAGTQSELKFYHSAEPLSLECGTILPSHTLAYHTFGKMNEERDNVIWIVHALTANSDPTEWWPEMVGRAKYIDIDQHFVICVNNLGSPYGSTSPLSDNPHNGQPYYHDFPLVTHRDQVHAFDRLRQHLHIDKILLLIGASIGGQLCLEWSIMNPSMISQQLLIATNAVHSPWGIALNESQRLAIYADQSWGERQPDAGSNGLSAARSIALLSYRTYDGYNITQQESSTDKLGGYRAASYQRYQGDKLVKRFNAYAYVALTKMMDSHHIGRGRGRVEDVLSVISVRTNIIGINSDILFPISEQSFLYTHIPRSKFYMITSQFGHDGFLTENDKVGRIVSRLMRINDKK
jgi:homoserine O-acetyltransferase/O-succinyltransferase